MLEPLEIIPSKCIEATMISLLSITFGYTVSHLAQNSVSK